MGSNISNVQTAIPPAVQALLPSVPGVPGMPGSQGVPGSSSSDSTYKIVLHVRGNTTLNSDGSKLFPIIAWLPETFNLQFSSQWEAPMEGTSAGSVAEQVSGGRLNAGMVDMAAGASGIATRSKYQTFQVWKNSSAMTFSFEMVFHATKDSDAEVRAKHIALLKLAAPSEAGSMLVPPGPTVAGQALSDSSQLISLSIGRYLYLDNVIITSVSSDIQTRFDALGNPIALSIALSVSSFYTAFTTADIDKMFKKGNSNV